jgi:C-terminal processing protease CtpA/Prc
VSASVAGRLAAALLGALLVVDPTHSQPPTPTPEGMAADFDLLWSTLNERYAYFDRKTTDWRCVKERYGPEAKKAKGPGEFVAVLERALDELYDPHTHLRTNTPRSTRLIPSGLDVWAEWRDGKAVITQLRPGFSADQAGLRPGLRLLSVGGLPVEEAVRRRLGACVSRDDPGARAWALLALLAGTHDTPRLLVVEGPNGRPRRIELDRPEHLRVGAAPDGPAVVSRRLDDAIGYVQVRDLGSDETIPLFDAALDALRDTRALILDLRDIPAGGNTSVAEPILGRFVESTRNYQRILPRGGLPWTRTVAPRGPAYRAPLVVLVGRWTASMAEGMAIGLDGMGRASVVGTRMAGLNGAVFDLDLPNSGIGVSYAAEKLAHLDGTPREDFVPRVLVDLADPDAPALGDPVLEAGVRTARRVAGSSR